MFFFYINNNITINKKGGVMTEKYCPEKTVEEIQSFIQTNELADLVSMKYCGPGEESSPIRHTFKIKFKKPAWWKLWPVIRKLLPDIELRVLCLSGLPIEDGSGFQVWIYPTGGKSEHEQFEGCDEAIAHLKKTIINLLGRKLDA